MKTEGDYLWDKTGAPDPEIQRLEEILGTLRYQPRPLEIPAGLSVGQERSFFRSAAPRLAIAATVAMLLIGLGVWLALKRAERSQPASVARSADAPAAKPNPAEQSVKTGSPDKQQLAPAPDRKSAVALSPKTKDAAPLPGSRQPRLSVNRSFVAANSKRNQARRARELQEAAVARDQLMLALRVTSAKLSFAQKKTQSPNGPEPVHNQHKTG